MAIIIGKATLKPGRFIKDNLKHKNVSEGDKRFEIASRYILGKLVKFYNDGYREIIGVELDEQEIHDSQILRFAHASLLINEPVGDKKLCWVDARTNPVNVWIYNKEIKSISDLMEIANHVTNE